jgi:hypothetical protein
MHTIVGENNSESLTNEEEQKIKMFNRRCPRHKLNYYI